MEQSGASGARRGAARPISTGVSAPGHQRTDSSRRSEKSIRLVGHYVSGLTARVLARLGAGSQAVICMLRRGTSAACVRAIVRQSTSRCCKRTAYEHGCALWAEAKHACAVGCTQLRRAAATLCVTNAEQRPGLPWPHSSTVRLRRDLRRFAACLRFVHVAKVCGMRLHSWEEAAAAQGCKCSEM